MRSLLCPASRCCNSRPADRCHVALHKSFSTNPLGQSCGRCRSCKENQEGYDAPRSPPWRFSSRHSGESEVVAHVEAIASRGHHGATAFSQSSDSSQYLRDWHPRLSEPGTMVSKDNKVDYKLSSGFRKKMLVTKRDLNQKDVVRLTCAAEMGRVMQTKDETEKCTIRICSRALFQQGCQRKPEVVPQSFTFE